MESFLISAGLSILWTAVGVILLFGSAMLFDRLHPLALSDEIAKGNIAAGIFLGAVVLGMGIIIAVAIH